MAPALVIRLMPGPPYPANQRSPSGPARWFSRAPRVDRGRELADNAIHRHPPILSSASCVNQSAPSGRRNAGDGAVHVRRELGDDAVRGDPPDPWDAVRRTRARVRSSYDAVRWQGDHEPGDAAGRGDPPDPSLDSRMLPSASTPSSTPPCEPDWVRADGDVIWTVDPGDREIRVTRLVIRPILRPDHSVNVPSGPCEQ